MSFSSHLVWKNRFRRAPTPVDSAGRSRRRIISFRGLGGLEHADPRPGTAIRSSSLSRSRAMARNRFFELRDPGLIEVDFDAGLAAWTAFFSSRCPLCSQSLTTCVSA